MKTKFAGSYLFVALLSVMICLHCTMVAGAAASAWQDEDQPSTDLVIEISDEAREIHDSGMLFDGHNDLPWTMRMNASSSFDNVDIAETTEFHTDIPRLRSGSVKVQYWSVFVPASTDLTGAATVQTFEQIRLVRDMCERYPDVFEMAATTADIRRIVGEGKIASMCGVEGGHSIGNSLQTLRELYDQGARYMTLTHSKTIAWADSATDEPKNNGLSPFGKEVVREMNRIGMLVDLSHVSEKCMMDALEVTRAPVIFSHSSARTICDHPRNVSDDVLKKVADNGGVVMINFMSGYIVPTDELEENENARGDYKDVCDHIEHVIKIAGIDHVGIGSDYDGVRSLPVGLEDVSTYPVLTQELMNRGYNREQLHKILGGNAFRVLEQAETVAAEIKAERVAAATPVTPLFKLTLAGADADRMNEVVSTMVDAKDFDGNVVTLTSSDGRNYLGQLSAPSIGATDVEGMRQLTFVAPAIKAGESLELVATDAGLSSYREFNWHDDEYGTASLHFHETPLLAYKYEPLDESRRQETYKVFHHVYTPLNDQGIPVSKLMTKGPGGLFPHHRGLFYGFNRIQYGDNKSADVWHCKEGASQTHERSLIQIGGPAMGRDVNAIYWRGKDGEPFAREIRELSTYIAGGNTVVDVCTVLESMDGTIKLNGDPQHAGFQFRASQDLPDQTKGLTYYIRPDGVDEPGNFRNWSPKKDETEINKSHVDLPWHALCMSLPVQYEWRGEERNENRVYTVARLNHPDNPEGQRYSERDYGRFGSYFVHEMDEDNPLTIRYRFVIMDGEKDVAAIEALHQSYVAPLSVEK